MWGLDLTQDLPTGADSGQRQSQWIELYVHSNGELEADSAALDISLRISGTRMGNAPGTLLDLNDPVTAADFSDDDIVVDVVSTIDRFGGSWGSER